MQGTTEIDFARTHIFLISYLDAKNQIVLSSNFSAVNQ
jgi:hypothetical protein